MLMGLLVGDDLGLLTTLVDAFAIRQLAGVILLLTTTVIAVTIVIGIFNLLTVHIRRVFRREGGWLNSLVLMLSFLAALGLYVIDRAQSMILLEDVQVAVESALAGLLYFSLVYGAYRLLHNRVTLPRIIFVLSMLVVLLGSLALPGLDILADFGALWSALPVSAGARGILLGIALATVVTGLRILLGQDRSYRE
jgi:hypothetical protein